MMSGESLGEIAKYYNEHHQTEISEDLQGQSPCCVYDNDNLTAIICIDEWKNDSQHIGYLAHEVLHLLICISHVCECPINIYTSECWAYAMNSFLETFLEILNTHHLKKEKKNAGRDVQQRSRKRNIARKA